MTAKTAITVKLSSAHIDMLENELGGKTQGIETLLDRYLKNKNAGEPDLEKAFLDCLLLPPDKNLRRTYAAFLAAYLKKGKRAGTVDGYIRTITGDTGFDDSTTRKHFRKLVGSGFINPMLNMMFRPTTRLQPDVSTEHFGDIEVRYASFLRCENNFEDCWSDGSEGELYKSSKVDTSF